MSDATKPAGGSLRTNVKMTFMDLPRELRDAIYHHIWQHSPKLVFPAPCKDHLDYHGRVDICGGNALPQWLLASRTVFQEGLEQLFRRAAWSCNGECDSNLIRGGDFNTALFATRLRLPGKKERGTREQPAVYYGLIIAPAFAPTTLARFGPHLRHFRMGFHHSLPSSDGNILQRRWEFDLSCLDRVALSLDTFAISCTARRMGSLTSNTIAPGLVRAYEVEIRRVGARLVGHDATVNVEQSIRVEGVWNRRSSLPMTQTWLWLSVKCEKKGCKVSMW